MSNAIAYSIKVWITSVILGSIVTNLPFILQSADWYELVTTLFGGTLLIMAVAAFFSLCSWIVLAFITYLLTRKPFNIRRVKLMLSGLSLIFSLAPLLFLTGGSIGADLTNSLAYITYPAFILAGLWYYKLEPVV